MELGDTSQLKAYERAMEHCSDEGNRLGVEMFGRLIIELAKTKREEAFKNLDGIMAMDVPKKIDKTNARTYKNNIIICDDWIEKYSPDAPRYKEKLSQADVNSWKRGGGGTSCL